MKQCFSEKIPVATVSKLELFTNTGSTPKTFKKLRSHGLKPTKMFMQTLEANNNETTKRACLCAFFFFPELFQHHYGLTRKTSIKNSLFLVRKAVSASFVNYKLTPEKTRFVPNSVHQHKILFLSP